MVAREILEAAPALRMLMERALRSVTDPMSLLRFRMLARLREEPCSNSELAEAVMVSPPTASPIVEDFVQRGWVRREADPRDRRAVLLTLTPVGARALKRTQNRLEIALAQPLADVGEPTLRSLARGLRGLNHSLARKYGKREEVAY